MLAVTERAKQELKKILATHVDYPMAGLRLRRFESDRFALSIDVEEPGDQVVKHEGVKVLLVEKELASALQGTIIDIEDTPEGPRLTAFEEPQGQP
jgi:Fe-S cluster assembly iron-binding protein IscA